MNPIDGVPRGDAFRKLRADVTALEERLTKLESEAVRHGPEVDALATTREVAEFLHLTENTVKTWRTRGQGPPWFTLEGTIRYRWADVETWLGKANGGGGQ